MLHNTLLRQNPNNENKIFLKSMNKIHTDKLTLEQQELIKQSRIFLIKRALTATLPLKAKEEVNFLIQHKPEVKMYRDILIYYFEKIDLYSQGRYVAKTSNGEIYITDFPKVESKLTKSY